MSSAPLLALLRVTFLLPGMQALTCQWQTLESVLNVSSLPFQWTSSRITCEIGEGCQDTLMLIENGPQVNLVLSKGCTMAKDQEAQITEHRARPGLSVLSYTRVCRHKDLCNDLSSTAPLWTRRPSTVPGNKRCPVCFSTSGCPENGPDQLCPAGHKHCYNGVLKLRRDGITTNLRVQGCMPQPGCNLLNGTQKIGSMTVSENCDLKPDTLSCYGGVILQTQNNWTTEPFQWTSSGSRLCEAEEVCQETLLFIDVGQHSLLAGSKGCSKAGTQDSQNISIHSGPPGILVASYARFCSSDLCNRANDSSILLSSLPKPATPAPGDLRCPMCVSPFGSCSMDSNFFTCPKGTTHCYNGYLSLGGGGLSTMVGIQGCMVSTSKSLLSHSQTLGIFSVVETNLDDNKEKMPLVPDGASSATFLVWTVGLGLFLALWGGGLPFPLH